MASPNQMAPVSSTEPGPRVLTAYRVGGWRKYLKIVPAPPDRFWMDFTTEGWANRCLPLRIANQAGWCILNDADFEVKWNGSKQLGGVKLTFARGQSSVSAQSMFGYGVVTWSIPYLFRTPPGFNLLVRGPANNPKDGAIALDGIVETDWLPYPFTMNWKITRPGRAVKFERDEPICMITPVRREDVESFRPEIRNIEANPELNQSYQAWQQRRAAIVKSLKDGRPVGTQKSAEGHYIRGEGVLGERTSEHQAKLELRTFVESEPATDSSPAGEHASVPRRSLLARVFGRRQ